MCKLGLLLLTVAVVGGECESCRMRSKAAMYLHADYMHRSASTSTLLIKARRRRVCKCCVCVCVCAKES